MREYNDNNIHRSLRFLNICHDDTLSPQPQSLKSPSLRILETSSSDESIPPKIVIDIKNDQDQDFKENNNNNNNNNTSSKPSIITSGKNTQDLKENDEMVSITTKSGQNDKIFNHIFSYGNRFEYNHYTDYKKNKHYVGPFYENLKRNSLMIPINNLILKIGEN